MPQLLVESLRTIASYCRRIILLILLLGCISCGNRTIALENNYQEALQLLSEEDCEEALWLLLEIEDRAEQIENRILTAKACELIAQIMQESGNYEEEKQYARKAVNRYSEAGMMKEANAARVYLQAGEKGLHNYLKSLAVADTVIALAKQFQDKTTLVQSLETDIQSCVLLGPDYYERLFVDFEKLKGTEAQVSSKTYACVARAYYYSGQDREASDYLKQAYESVETEEELIQVQYVDYLINRFFHNPEYADSILTRIIWEQNARYEKRVANDLLRSMNEYNRLHRNELIVSSKRHIRSTVKIIIVLSILLCLSFLGHYQYKRWVEKERKRVARALDAQTTAMEELKTTTSFREEVAVKIGFETLDALCSEYYSGGHSKDKKVVKAFEDMIHQYRENPEFWNVFEERVNQMNGGIISLMKTELPHIKTSDVRLSTYIISGMSYFSISVLMDMDKPNLYNKAKRLRDHIRSSDCEHKDLFLKALSRSQRVIPD